MGLKSRNKIYSLAAVIALVFITGCNPISIATKGQYETDPFEFTSNESVDSPWSKVIKLFSEKGVAIKKVDKEKGTLLSRKSLFLPAYTFEDKNGLLVEPDAWVVLRKTFVNEKEWTPKTIYSEWSIQITTTATGESTIIIDPVVMCTYYPNMFTSVETHAQSTGKLEDLIKHSSGINPKE